MADLPLGPFHTWTSRPYAMPGECNGDTLWHDVVGNELWPSRGFKKLRQVASVTSKPGDYFVHRTETGQEYPWYLCSTGLYPETGSDSPAALKSSLTETWQYAASGFASQGASVFVNGTNAQAQLVRENSGGSALEAVDFDFAQPDTNWTATNSSDAGASIPDGTYLVRISQYDDQNSSHLVESQAAASKSVTVSAGGTGRIVVAQNTWTPDTRATKWRIYVTAAGASDTVTAYHLETTVAIGTTSVNIDSLTGTGDQPVNRNGFERTSVMPLSNVDVCCQHKGRLFIASTQSNEVYWSERNAPNQWYSTNGLNNGAESNWNSPVRGMASANDVLYVFTADSIHIVVGDFRRDDTGDNPTYAAFARPELLEPGIGCLSHRSIVPLGSYVYFMSTRGPARMGGNAVQLLRWDDMVHAMTEWDWSYMDRCCAAEDGDNGHVCWAVPRLVNSSRPQDGASVAGIPDMIYRFDYKSSRWVPPLRLDTVGLRFLPFGTAGTNDNTVYLLHVSPYGTLGQMNWGWAGGPSGAVSGTDYDGKLASATTTTSATFGVTGITGLVGWTVTLTYPSGDSNYPYVVVQKTISSFTDSGSATTVNWQGALTAPSGTEWTVRLAGLWRPLDVVIDPLQYQMGPRVQLQMVDAVLQDVVGTEAVA